MESALLCCIVLPRLVLGSVWLGRKLGRGSCSLSWTGGLVDHQSLLLGRLWDAYGTPTERLRDAYGTPMGRLWDAYGTPWRIIRIRLRPSARFFESGVFITSQGFPRWQRLPTWLGGRIRPIRPIPWPFGRHWTDSFCGNSRPGTLEP